MSTVSSSSTHRGNTNPNSLIRFAFFRRLMPVFLLAPLTIFMFVFFIVPIAKLLVNGVYDPAFHRSFPHTVEQITDWDSLTLPGELVFEALVKDLQSHERPAGFSSSTRRLLEDAPELPRAIMTLWRDVNRDIVKPPYRTTIAAHDPIWGNLQTWHAIREAGKGLTPTYLLTALDLRIDQTHSLKQLPPEERLFTEVLFRSLTISFVVTLACLFLGYPVAYHLSVLPVKKAAFLMFFVMLPLWTSLIVRSSAWVILLQTNGALNGLLQSLGLTDKPVEMIYNRHGVYIAMTHVMLPFMVLPLFATMKTIPPSLSRAAASLGASPVTSFFKVYFPLTSEGIFAGTLIVFTMSLGYYLTPLLVGGRNDQMISYYIANFTNVTVNWGMAAALSIVLLTVSAALYGFYSFLKNRLSEVAYS